MLDIRVWHFQRVPTRNLFFIAVDEESWGDAAVNHSYDLKKGDFHRSRPIVYPKKSRVHHVTADFRGR